MAKLKRGTIVKFKRGYGFTSTERAVISGYRKSTKRYTFIMTTGKNKGVTESAPRQWIISIG